MTGRYEAIDLNHDVARWTRDAADGSLVVAEHGHDFRPDLDGTGWHGAMNYAGFLKPTWWWLRDDSIETDVFSSAPAPRYDGAELVERDAALPHRRPVAGRRALVDAARLARHRPLRDGRRPVARRCTASASA